MKVHKFKVHLTFEVELEDYGPDPLKAYELIDGRASAFLYPAGMRRKKMNCLSIFPTTART